MKAIGFNFNKISAEKLESKGKDLKINTEMDVSNIKKLDTDLFKGKDEVLEVRFVYNVDYKPDFAKIKIEGAIIFQTEQKKAKQILKDWKKKKLSEEFRLSVFNIILKKSSLKALELEDELNLPFHIPMPSFKKK